MARSAKPRKQKNNSPLPAPHPGCTGGLFPAQAEQIMKLGCFFPTSAARQITAWRKIFRTCLKKMSPAIIVNDG
ncbi:hypothetical protein KNZ44_004800 [Escherichia coli]|nr:hypothetical protein [Escherichia coli]